MSQADRSEIAVRVLTIMIAAGLIGYAISDHAFYGGLPGFGRGQLFIMGSGLALLACAVLSISANKVALLISASLLVVLLVAEIGGELLLAPHHRAPYLEDAESLFKLQPGARSATTRLSVNGGQTVYHQINRDGFRGPELGDGSKTRVMVYGDALIHAPYSEEENTFVGRLDLLLGEKMGRDFEVINAGVSAYGPDQILVRLGQDLDRYQPDLVLVAISAGNDYGDLLRNKIFELDAKGQLVLNDFELAESIKARFEMSRAESVIKQAMRRFFAPSGPSFAGASETKKSGIALMDAWLAQADHEDKNARLLKDDRVTNTHLDRYSADLSLKPRSPSAEYKVQLMNAVLAKIHAKLRERGVSGAMLFVPHPIDVVEEYSCCGRVDRPRFPDYDRRNLIAPLEGLAKARGIPFVSFFDPFKQSGAEKFYFEGGADHWNDAGQRFAAEIVSDFLVEEGLLRRVAGGSES